MSSRARLLLPVCLFVAIAAACGGEPPEKEIQQARTAIQAAVTAGADRWASEELAGAQDALKQADEAVNQRDYRLALNHALDSLEKAQNAARDAAARKTAAKDQADRAIGSATAAITSTRAKLKAVEGRAPARTVASLHSTLTTAEERVQEARAAYERGDWAASGAATATAMQALTAANVDLDALSPKPAPKKR